MRLAARRKARPLEFRFHRFAAPGRGRLPMPRAADPPDQPESNRRYTLVLTALGVVFGDIGTSPLYAVRQSLVEYGEISERSVFGVLSLMTWALLLVVTLKYVLVIMRADNRGE